MKIEFDAERHLYRLDGAPVPAVTSILSDLFDWQAVAPDTLEHKRQIGLAVHRAIALELDDDLDRSSVEPRIEGYLEGWKRFQREKRFSCHLSECCVASKRFRYAGTLDLAGTMDAADVLVDVKCGEPHAATSLQTAAYLNAAREMGFLSNANRFALHLGPEGVYRLEPYADPNDFAVFLSCLSRHNWQVWKHLMKEPT